MAPPGALRPGSRLNLRKQRLPPRDRRKRIADGVDVKSVAPPTLLPRRVNRRKRPGHSKLSLRQLLPDLPPLSATRKIVAVAVDAVIGAMTVPLPARRRPLNKPNRRRRLRQRRRARPAVEQARAALR